MIEKKISCPKCDNELIVKGNIGDKINVTCPKCNTYGTYTFHKDKDSKKLDCFDEFGDICFKKLLFLFISSSLMRLLYWSFFLL